MIAFFDLDRTLVDVNSAKLWIKRELKGGFITRRQAARAVGWVALYELGFANIEEVIEQAMGSLAGEPEGPVVERTQRFWAEEIRSRIRPGAFDAVARHRERGHKVVLLSSTSNYMAAEAQADLELDDVLCNRFEIVDGVFTGKPLRPLCFGAGKVEHAARYAAELEVPLEECAFYTDSYSDAPMLEVVGEPVCVDPDPRLKRLAKKREWVVVEWGSAG